MVAWRISSQVTDRRNEATIKEIAWSPTAIELRSDIAAISERIEIMVQSCDLRARPNDNPVDGHLTAFHLTSSDDSSIQTPKSAQRSDNLWELSVDRRGTRRRKLAS
jgi:hypothetical protein